MCHSDGLNVMLEAVGKYPDAADRLVRLADGTKVSSPSRTARRQHVQSSMSESGRPDLGGSWKGGTRDDGCELQCLSLSHRRSGVSRASYRWSMAMWNDRNLAPIASSVQGEAAFPAPARPEERGGAAMTDYSALLHSCQESPLAAVGRLVRRVDRPESPEWRGRALRRPARLSGPLWRRCPHARPWDRDRLGRGERNRTSTGHRPRLTAPTPHCAGVSHRRFSLPRFPPRTTPPEHRHTNKFD